MAHVEAGLRSGNLVEPFPEEFNRRMIGLVSRLHFAPTSTNYENLIREGVDSDSIFVTGNTVIDAVLSVKGRAIHQQEVYGKYQSYDGNLTYQLDDFGDNLIVVTVHRRENQGNRLLRICDALKISAANNPQVSIVVTVHPNPNVSRLLTNHLSGIPNIFLINPCPYPNFICLLVRARAIVSDSGGIQEEATALDKRLLIIRSITERTEVLESPKIKLVSPSSRFFRQALDELLDSLDANFPCNAAVFGDGTASKRIHDELLKFLEVTK